jgi:hypothetical protein
MKADRTNKKEWKMNTGGNDRNKGVKVYKRLPIELLTGISLDIYKHTLEHMVTVTI